MNRRSFLKALATCFVAAALPVGAAFAHQRERLRLWGDGVHDDAPFIQALIDRTARLGHKHAALQSGVYTISTPIVFDERHSYLQLHGMGDDGVIFQRSPDAHPGDPMIIFRPRTQGVNVRPSILVNDQRVTPTDGYLACP